MATARTAAGRGLQIGKRARGVARLFLGGCLFLEREPSRAGPPRPVSRCSSTTPARRWQSPRRRRPRSTPARWSWSPGPAGSGWVLKDANGRALRRFYSSNGRDVDTWSYFKDGVEVHRQVDTTGSGRPDQYRWMNGGGSKWGVDVDKNGTIDTWK